MLYLLLAILCSSSIALIFKYSETTGLNRYAVTSANYLTACTVSVILILASGITVPSDLNAVSSLERIGGAIVGKTVSLSPADSFLWAIVAGAGAGLFFFLAFIYYQVSVRDYGVGLAGSFAKLGILVPMSLSLVFWREYPSSWQWAGIGMAVLSIVLVNWPGEKSMRRSLHVALLLLFVFAGIAEFSNKVYQKHGLQDYKSVFLLVTFFVAFVFSVAATLGKNRRVTARDLLIGIAVGVPNLFSSFFLIRALDSVPAAVAFPAFGAGTIVIINVVGLVFFRERLSRYEKFAVGLTVIALILINL
jgi:multidrug transporter EmrE-like cation transporter